MLEFENTGCTGFTEVKDGQCRPASEGNTKPLTLREEKENVLRFDFDCFYKTIYVKAEHSISLDLESVNSTTE